MLWGLIQSHRVTAVIYIAAKLGIAELLRDGPRSLAELAQATRADKQALGRLLVALSIVGVCAPVAGERYSLTEMGAALDGNAEPSFKESAIFEGQMLSPSWNGMLDSIITGKTAAQLQGVDDAFDLMRKETCRNELKRKGIYPPRSSKRFPAFDPTRAYAAPPVPHSSHLDGGAKGATSVLWKAAICHTPASLTKTRRLSS